jgi:hypothetical protein
LPRGAVLHLVAQSDAKADDPAQVVLLQSSLDRKNKADRGQMAVSLHFDPMTELRREKED